MRWRGHKESRNVEDRRGMGTGGKVVAGGGIGAIILIVLGLLTGQDLTSILGGITSESTTQTSTQPVEQRADEMDKFVKVVLHSTEEVWTDLFKSKMNMNYRLPGLVIFRGSTQSACGLGNAAMGPFYCPADEKAYIDLSFCDQLRTQFKAPGEFAVAYVIAHEVGHHIQNLLGISSQVQSQRGRISESDYNRLSVMVELQADYLAGVWAHHSHKQNQWLDPSDIEAALRAANAIGDDNLQKQAQGYIVPESFTHGTSEQRIRWFKNGFQQGAISREMLMNLRTFN